MLFGLLRGLFGRGNDVEIQDATALAIRKLVSKHSSIPMDGMRDSSLLYEIVHYRLAFNAICCMQFGKTVITDRHTTVGDLIAQLTEK